MSCSVDGDGRGCLLKDSGIGRIALKIKPFLAGLDLEEVLLVSCPFNCHIVGATGAQIVSLLHDKSGHTLFPTRANWHGAVDALAVAL